jgi:hypothetical protein
MKPQRFLNVIKCFALFTGIALSTTLWAIDLQDEMSKEEFTSAGLAKLSPTELQYLEQWLAKQHTDQSKDAAASTDEIVSTDPPVREPARERTVERAAFDAEIVGEFDGFRGKGTRITLSNGQVWEQTDNTTSSKVRSKAVRIKPALLGRWRMRLKDNNVFATVERIQ